MESELVLKYSRIGLLSPELIYMIWEFNYEWAANKLQTYGRKYLNLKIQYVINVINMVSLNYDFSYLNYLNYLRHIESKQDILNILNLCKCCSRHQFNKPRSHIKWFELPMSVIC